ncbi:hypothetical protein [Enterococcus rivorum]|uniref:DUF4320 family protein n=1 Tax=Enterococcus rivorum TaxID=762845 RepID=A0A1E5L0N4_9ENTE|nr:hypothetical protein [Enterococcus rivorum]MBP2098906.1 hypothetical protein [Enterococcus rivorum]OEH83631.1 hypothetical protein BCR26_09140 [Enterococcus rivorum]
MDSYISLLVKLLIGAIAVVSFVGLWALGLGLSDVNNYKQRVNYTIERYGGLTDDALQELARYGEENTHAVYTVESPQLHEKVPFGETVTYAIQCEFQTPLLPVTVFSHTIKGSATAQIR